MEIIPLIHFKERRVLGQEGDKYKIDGFLKEVESLEKLYVLDYDGIERNKPNLCTYQKLSKSIEIWVDAGPSDLGDIVDTVMAGATDITLRKKIWPYLDTEKIREITENKLYLEIDLKKQDRYELQSPMKSNIDGLVILDKTSGLREDFISIERLKNLAKKYKMYIYETNQRDIDYWNKIGICGLIVDLDKLMEFRKHGL